MVYSLEVFLGSMFGVIINSPRGIAVLSSFRLTADLPTASNPTLFNVLFRKYADLTLLRHSVTTIPVQEY